MKIIETPSPNHDERTLPITMLVLHYTGMETGDAASIRLRDKNAKVSAHYMVHEDGQIDRLVQDDKRAWHAGVSYWDGQSNINSASIGVEIVNGGHDFGLPDFPDTQIKSVIQLCKVLKAKHAISDHNIIGHSDIAPDRKQDPGEKFPWARLADSDVGIWPDIKTSDQTILFAENDEDAYVKVCQRGLAYLGYGVPFSGIMDAQTQLVAAAFQRRYRPSKIDGFLDMQTIEILNLLVKYKKKTTR